MELVFGFGGGKWKALPFFLIINTDK